MSPNPSVLPHSYLRLAQRLQTEVRQGRYRPGERLPSVRALATAHGVSVDTAVRCYRHLEALGWVQARHKSGVYVADRAAPPAPASPEIGRAHV